jgi:ADP-dependent NAD(P)H-hydrate dehydratase / NAD(P)H-hydrate epimerase
MPFLAPVEGIYVRAIQLMNAAEATRVSVDVPSGLQADRPSEGEIVRAGFTVCFQLPKLAFFFPQSYPFTGEWCTVDIGLDKSFIRKAETKYFFTTLKDCKKILRPRLRFDHKGTYGHALMIAGSFGKMGACLLASHAALRAGVGLLTAHVPGCGYQIVQTSLPEAMVDIDPDDQLFTQCESIDKFDAIGIGPGLGQDAKTVKALGDVLRRFKKPMVIDADALNILSSNRELLHLIPENSVLTPHPREFERLAGSSKNDFERLGKQIALAAQLKSVVVLKGAYSSIATPHGKVYFNSTGNPGMAKGGSGDVLTGILTALLAQGYSSDQAAILGLFLHGLAGDIGVQELGMTAFLPSDLIQHLPRAFQRLGHK